MSKMDQHIKDKLESRRIQPSAQSWDKLAEKLDANQQKSKRSFWWLGVAASFIAGIALTSIWFESQENQVAPAVVNEAKSEEMITTPTQKSAVILHDEVEQEDTAVAIKDKDIPIEESLSMESKPKVNQPKIDQELMPKPQVSVAVNKKPVETMTNLTKEEQWVATIDKKAQSVVDEVKRRSEKRQVTDAEIEALIRKAQFEIRSGTIFSENRNEVDAQALLKDVEADLDKSFRERIFIAIENGFGKVKSAVSFIN